MGGIAARPGEARLLERAGELDALARALASVTSSGQGRIVLVAGEAGIGKTALLRRFRADLDGSARVLWARCEPLFTPRPLGPVLELAGQVGGELAARAGDGGRPYDVAAALLRELAGEPSVLVFEDVHWADEATLDVIRLAGRRVADVPTLLVLSYRGDGLDRSHPLRIVLGDLPGSDRVTRVALAGLSPRAVAELVGWAAVAILRFAPAAAERAAAAGARREAVGLYARALRFADGLEPAERAELLERFAGLTLYIGMGEEGAAALREAVEIHRSRGDLLRQGDALRQLGIRLGATGALPEATAVLAEAVAVLEQVPGGPELARAYNAMAAVLGVFDDNEAQRWGKRRSIWPSGSSAQPLSGTR